MPALCVRAPPPQTDPTTLNRQGNDRGTQYRSGIYFHDAGQLQEAEAKIAEVNGQLADGSSKWAGRGKQVRRGRAPPAAARRSCVQALHDPVRTGSPGTRFADCAGGGRAEAGRRLLSGRGLSPAVPVEGRSFREGAERRQGLHRPHPLLWVRPATAAPCHVRPLNQAVQRSGNRGGACRELYRQLSLVMGDFVIEFRLLLTRADMP